MKKYVYVENVEKLIYKVEQVEIRLDGWANVELELVCGYDYINTDESNEQGYVDKEQFVEEAQSDLIACDIMNESIKEALEFHGYTVREVLPQIHESEVKKPRALILYKDFNHKEQMQLCERYAEVAGYEVIGATKNVVIAKVAANDKEYDILLTANVESFGTDISEAADNTVDIRSNGVDIVVVTEKKIQAKSNS